MRIVIINIDKNGFGHKIILLKEIESKIPTHNYAIKIMLRHATSVFRYK